MQITTGSKFSSGLITISWEGRKKQQGRALHLWIPMKEDRCWWFERDWYDGPYYYFGLGKLLLFVWN